MKQMLYFCFLFIQNERILSFLLVLPGLLCQFVLNCKLINCKLYLLVLDIDWLWFQFH